MVRIEVGRGLDLVEDGSAPARALEHLAARVALCGGLGVFVSAPEPRLGGADQGGQPRGNSAPEVPFR